MNKRLEQLLSIMKSKVGQDVIKVILFFVFFLYHCLLIVLVSSVITDTPESIKANEEAGFGPDSGFVLFFLFLSGIAPIGAIILALISHLLLYKKVMKLHKKGQGIAVFILMHVVILLLLYWRMEWVFRQ